MSEPILDILREPDGYIFDRGLQSGVERIEYSVRHRLGTIWMPKGSCTSMDGAIDLFKRIDPEVQSVITMAGLCEDTSYQKQRDGTWIALRPMRKR